MSMDVKEMYSQNAASKHQIAFSLERITESIVDLLQKIVSKSDVSPVTSHTSLKNDLGFNSISIVLLVLEIEEYFDTEVEWDFSFDTPLEAAQCIYKQMR